MGFQVYMYTYGYKCVCVREDTRLRGVGLSVGGVRSFHFIPKCPSFNISNVLRDASVLQPGRLASGPLPSLLSRSVLQLVVIVRR